MRRRRLGALVAAGLLLAACGSTDDADPVAATPDDAADPAADDDTASESTDDFAAATDEADGADDADDADDAAYGDDLSGKPVVEIPAELPTELVITDLVAGSGEAAEVGDTVTVHYIGVRSEDGTEFDNSYDGGSPFSVVLGAGGVIPGWEEGLLGARAGERRQLDIPAELAYGENGSGPIIQPGDALTFVIDVLAVTPGAGS